MSTTATFTGLSFVLLHAHALDASVVVAEFNYPPNIGSGTYTLTSAHGETRTCTQAAGGTAQQIYLYVDAPLSQDFWTLTYSGQTTASPPIAIIPGSYYFWVSMGVVPVGATAPPFSGSTLTAAKFIRQQIPSSMKGRVWDCLIAGLGVGEQAQWDNAPLVERSMFTATATGEWLDRRAANLGFDRPLNVGILDDAFRDYVIQMSSRQLTTPAILEMLRVFFGRQAVQAYTYTTNEPFALVDNMALPLTLDGVQDVNIIFKAIDFADMNAALAVEVAGVINRELQVQGVNALALVQIDATTNVNQILLFSGTLGARSQIQIQSSAGQVALGLPTTLSRLLGQDGSAYVLSRGSGVVEVVMPATSVVVARTTANACYLTIDAATAGNSGYLFEGVNKGLSVTATSTTITNTLLAGHGYRIVNVSSSANFADTAGYVVFGYGFDYATTPVPYLGRAGATGLIIDPGYVFAATLPAGTTVNMLVDAYPPTTSFTGDFILTDSAAGRVAAQQAISDISAGGYEVNVDVNYPSDVGLGNEGEATSGTQRISDIVGLYAGDIDTEVAAAREA